jgi:hypothetical protein
MELSDLREPTAAHYFQQLLPAPGDWRVCAVVVLDSGVGNAQVVFGSSAEVLQAKSVFDGDDDERRERLLRKLYSTLMFGPRDEQIGRPRRFRATHGSQADSEPGMAKTLAISTLGGFRNSSTAGSGALPKLGL